MQHRDVKQIKFEIHGRAKSEPTFVGIRPLSFGLQHGQIAQQKFDPVFFCSKEKFTQVHEGCSHSMQVHLCS